MSRIKGERSPLKIPIANFAMVSNVTTAQKKNEASPLYIKPYKCLRLGTSGHANMLPARR
jgi:hypothetical protein